MRKILILLFLLSVNQVEAREIWERKGFVLEVPKNCWVDNDMFPTWTGVSCGLTIPHNGYFAILKPGALELQINGKWVKDKGILITDGCPSEARSGGDTRAGACNITQSSQCEKEGGRIMLMVRIPKLFPTSGARPTKARWVQTKVRYNVETYR